MKRIRRIGVAIIAVVVVGGIGYTALRSASHIWWRRNCVVRIAGQHRPGWEVYEGRSGRLAMFPPFAGANATYVLAPFERYAYFTNIDRFRRFGPLALESKGPDCWVAFGKGEISPQMVVSESRIEFTREQGQRVVVEFDGER